MATHEMKTRFKLEGEQQYRQAMKEAANAVKVLNSESQLARAEFEASGDAQQYAADKARILKEQIEQQKKAVQAAEDAISNMTKNGVEPNDRKMQEWRTKLNNAKTALSRMQTQLNDTETELKEQSSATNKAKTAMQNAETKVKSLTKQEQLAEAQFKATGDQEAYLTEKARLLKEKIAAQKTAVEEAEAAIQSMTDNGVDPASTEMVEWKEKLAAAKTKLVQMETQLDKTETELQQQKSAVGEAKTAMAQAEEKIKSLTAEEALAEAQFKATGDKEQYASEKTRILKEKLEAQQTAVEAAETAIKSMTDNGVDPASDEMVEWKDKLVTAKTKLAQMQTQLNDTESELKDQSSSLNSAKNAMNLAEQKMKSLTQEEKLAETQFKETGDAEALLAEKTRILREKIIAQKSAVKAAEDAIKSMTENGVEENSEEVVEWKGKLAEARTGLLNLQRRLDNVGDEVSEETTAFNTAGTSAEDLDKSIKDVGKGIDYQNVISAIDGITDTIQKTVRMAARAAKAVWEMGVSSGQWADNILTAASEAGVDVETYQSWQYASRFIDTSVDDIIKSWQDIQKNMKEGNTDYLETLAKMGIRSRETGNQVRESSEIFWDVIDYLHGIGDASKQAEEATKIFGNDWRKMNPLISEGSAAYKAMADEGRSVAVVSEANVKALGGLDDQVQELGAEFDKLKFDTMAALAPTLKEIGESMTKVVRSLDQFVQSEEGQAAIQSLHDAVSGLIKSFLGEDNGQGSFESIVSAAKDAVKKLTDALDWIAKNGTTVRKIIMGMGVAWAGLKVSKTVLQFVELLSHTPLANIKEFFTGANGASAGSAAASSGAPASSGSSGVGKNAISKAKNWATKTGKKIGTALGADAVKDLGLGAGIAGGVMAAAILPAVLADSADRQKITQELDEIRETAAEAAAAIGEEGQAALDIVNTAADAVGISEDKLNVFGQGVIADAAAVEAAIEAVKRLDDLEGGRILSGKTKLRLKYGAGLTSAEQQNVLETAMMEAMNYLADPQAAQGAADMAEVISDAMDSIIDMQEALDEAPGDNIEALYSLVDTLGNDKDILSALSEDTQKLLAAYFSPDSGFGAGSAGQFADAQKVLDAMMADLDKAYRDAVTLGGNVSAGMAAGIYQREGEAIRAAQHLADAVTAEVADALDIQSPSKVMAKLGGFTALGFAEGIDGRAADVTRAVDRMIGATAARPMMAFGGVAMQPMGARVSAAGAATAGAGTVHVTMVLDDEILGDVMAPIINGKIGAKINATRR